MGRAAGAGGQDNYAYGGGPAAANDSEGYFFGMGDSIAATLGLGGGSETGFAGPASRGSSGGTGLPAAAAARQGEDSSSWQVSDITDAVSDGLSDMYTSTFGSSEDATATDPHTVRQQQQQQQHGRRTGFGSSDVHGGADWQGGGGGGHASQVGGGNFGGDLSSGGSLSDLDEFEYEQYRSSERDGEYGTVGRWMRDMSDYVLECTK